MGPLIQNNSLYAAGQKCRRCRTPVELRKPQRPPRKSKTKYFSWWLRCPKCNALYYHDSALVDNPQGTLFG